jgi:membrane fusion protein (multidrug efflux system)
LNDSLARQPAATKRSRIVPAVRLTMLLAMALALGLWAYGWIQTTLVQVHESDARISVDQVAVSSRMDGRLVARPVEEGSRVSRGDVIARIDDREARARFEELQAERRRLEAERDEIGARMEVVDARVTSRVAAEHAGLRSARALVEAIRAESAYAERESARSEKLSKQGVMSAKSLDSARTDYLTKQKELVRAEASVATALARLGEAKAERQEIRVLERERETLLSRDKELEARLVSKRIDVEDRVVRSPIDGVVSRTFVEPGEYVEAGQRIALLHDPSAVYIEANIRETDIRRVAPGQPVRIEVDAYPGRAFAGRVRRIGEAATSQFALLPNPNPSGHFTKVTQRLPVRIEVEDPSAPLRPGMMVEVFIDVGRE